jgi:UDP-glucose 4-epimerase
LKNNFLGNVLVTGCAGFIGSHLVDRLLSLGYNVIGLDNLSTGRLQFLSSALESKNFKFVEFDLFKGSNLASWFYDVDIVFHFAANADVRFGTDFPKRDLEQNTIVTHNVLDAMRSQNVKKIIFSSTGSVYGESALIPTPEDGPFPIQTSLYGASKLACEGLIAAYSEGFGFQSYIFRFVSILGERYTHGHVFDFYKKIKLDPLNLDVLGNGSQRKSYLYVQDCIDAIFLALEKSHEKVNIFNLGADAYCEINDSVQWICEDLGVKPTLHYLGGDRGWIGDNPFIYLDTKKIHALGWQSKFSIKEGVIKTLEYFKHNEWVFDSRN